MQRRHYFIVSAVRVPEKPDAPEARRLAAAAPLPPHPPGESFVRAGQGWRTAYALDRAFETREAAEAVLKTFPVGIGWRTAWGTSDPHAAALRVARRELRSQRYRHPIPAWKREQIVRRRDIFRTNHALHELTRERTLKRIWAFPATLQRDAWEALRLAAKMADPWWRSHYLSQAARALPDRAWRDLALVLALEAPDQYLGYGDRNRAVTAAHWPLAVLAELGETEWLRREIELRLPWIRAEEHPYRRADGLRMLVWSCPDSLATLKLAVLTEAAESFLACRPGWKRDWRLAFLTTWAIAPLDNDRAIEIARGIADGRKRRQTLRRLSVPEGEVR